MFYLYTCSLELLIVADSVELIEFYDKCAISVTMSLDHLCAFNLSVVSGNERSAEMPSGRYGLTCSLCSIVKYCRRAFMNEDYCCLFVMLSINQLWLSRGIWLPKSCDGYLTFPLWVHGGLEEGFMSSFN
uniref:Ovule protein n=1 Tax=Heterorhabditis bacteriophora TaxID=37862 RepID=A0A1I7XPZ3_HETBA